MIIKCLLKRLRLEVNYSLNECKFKSGLTILPRNPSILGLVFEILCRSFMRQRWGKTSEPGVQTRLLRPLRAGFWYILSPFPALAWCGQSSLLCRKSLIFCFLDEFKLNCYLNLSYLNCFFEGYHFPIKNTYYLYCWLLSAFCSWLLFISGLPIIFIGINCGFCPIIAIGCIWLMSTPCGIITWNPPSIG